MSLVENQGAKIYWDETGQGEPLLLIMGLGYGSALWHRIRPALASQFRTIAFDNRGVGWSDVPAGPYSIATMAADAAAVLDAAGASEAHIFGVSMGGMIAQEFALQYPLRTRSLILGCTSPGGPSALRAERKVGDILLARGISLEQAREAILPYIYDANTPRESIEEDLKIRRRSLPTIEGYTAQLQAVLAWEGYSRIDQIKTPTLVIHGKSDQLVPPGNGELLAGRIPGAKLVLLGHASHIFLTDQAEAAQREILEFLFLQGERESRSSTVTSATEVRGNALFPMDIPGRHRSSSK
ncbi:MAG: alpha/beta hydrolase [Terriglobales bacterium]|jgi:pimeloyl-ACP methyl ester carboxylesterase